MRLHFRAVLFRNRFRGIGVYKIPAIINVGIDGRGPNLGTDTLSEYDPQAHQ